MKQCLLWLCGLLMMPGISQTLHITDELTGEPVSFALVKVGNTATTADIEGLLDLTGWNVDTLFISAPGYLTKKVGLQRLALAQYKLKLHRSAVDVEEVMVSTHKEDPLRLTSLHLQPVDLSKPDQRGAFDLTQALTREPGVNMLSTGTGISKPVIRGLYGNRLLVLISGLRFDNQQWQDEHGLGLSNFGIDRVEVVKGPLSLLYGTEAVGGVLNIVEEKPPVAGTSESDLQLQAWSNTAGGFVQAGFKKNLGSKWWRIRVGTNNHADYSDGNGTRVLNSRFNGYYLKSSFGFRKIRWKSDNHYQFSFNNFGFIFNDITHYMDADGRWSRGMSGPHHIVMLNLLSSVNEFQLKRSVLRLNGGFQSNMRTEDEGGGELSLFMHLATLQYSLKWEKQLASDISMVVANGGSLENNTNYGRRKLVPDAWLGEQTGSFYLSRQSAKWLIEGGAGGGVRYINTLPTKGVNTGENVLRPFTQWRPYWNAMAGVAWFPVHGLSLKTNLSSGVRAPNLSELSANGLHEGIYVYELGDPDMTNEQNVNGEAGVYYSNAYLKSGVSVYENRFRNYIYLKPTSGDWFGFPVSEFTQGDATLTGGEAYVKIVPVPKAGITAGVTYAQVRGVLDNAQYLPFMPANKLVPELRYESRSPRRLLSYCFVSMDVVYAQNNISSNELKSPPYNLLNAGIGLTWKRTKLRYVLGISGNNLLNVAYADHLSRIRYFGFNNPGLNVCVTFRMTLTGSNKPQTK